MTDHNNQTETEGQSGSQGQSGIDQETERRNQENETGQQSQQPPQGGQQQQPEFGQQADYGSAEKSDAPTGQGQSGQAPETQSDGGSGLGFVGSAGDQSSDYLTEGENQDFTPEGQGASDSDAGNADITTGQPTSSDSSLDDGADTDR